MLRVTNLYVGFTLPDGREAEVLHGVSFDVARGERVGLVGESGCGKTTAMLAVMGLLPPNAWAGGSSPWTGKELLAASERDVRRSRWTDVAMIPQASLNALNPVRTVGSQISEPMLLHKTVSSRKAAAQRARELLELVGVSGAEPPGTRMSSPGACASELPSRWRSPATRRCCWRTSRRPRST